MSDDREAFHAAVWKAPDDDLPRLVYADWLDERGEADAATFLRLLCAVRTCPPDVDRLRPLVADFRRAMVKVPAEWIDDVCPVPPAVVVGAWVDVDHEANRLALRWIRKNRRSHSDAGDGERVTVITDVSGPWGVSERLTGRMPAVIPGTAVCQIEGVAAVVHVWSGVIVAVRRQTDYVARGPRRTPVESLFSPMFDVHSEFGSEWFETFTEWELAHGHERLLGYEDRQLQLACEQFDPASRPA